MLSPSFREKLVALKDRIEERYKFEAKGSVRLDDFRQVHIASAWCEDEYLGSGLRYRRYVDSDERTARFEFEDQRMAVMFKFAFGYAERYR